MGASPTYYELLGVDEDASDAEIKGAFRSEAKRQHPDQGGNAALFRLVERAYETLIDPDRRADYDAQLLNGDPTPPGGVRIDDANYSIWEDDNANEWRNDNPGPDGPEFIARPRTSRQVPDWVPTGKLARRLIVVAVAAYIGIALLLTGEILPGAADLVMSLLLWGLAIFFLGSILLRLAGWIVAITAIVLYFTGGHDSGSALLMLMLASALWLGGHWFFTLRKGYWRSMLAFSVLKHLPERLRPDRRWA